MRWHNDYFATPADLAECRALLRAGSKTFFAASLLLPPGVRESATAVYGFCRLADDAVDLDGGMGVLTSLRERLDHIYEGRPAAIAVDRAFADAVERFSIPRTIPQALLEGFEWDAGGRRYESLDDLHAYAARVAGTVGAMMSLLMGQRAPEVVARACELGMAMQLTNIARDVGEDARAGRLYLPRQWLREAGVDADAWLAHPVFDAAIGSVVRRVLRAADALYQRADVGIGRLPSRCRPGIHAARLLYAEIGREVESAQFNSVARRAVVPFPRKLSLLARAIVATAKRNRVASPGCHDAARFLVEAIPAASHDCNPSKAEDLDTRIAWLMTLFERLERRDRVERSGVSATVNESRA